MKIKENFDLAYLIAERSKDPSTKVGAVICDSYGRIISVGYNGFPRGVYDYPVRYENRELKYSLVVHAEVNAILNATQSLCHGGESYTMFVTHPCCNECAKLIAQTNIKTVYYDEASPEFMERFKDKFDITKLIFSEAKINLVKRTKEGTIVNTIDHNITGVSLNDCKFKKGMD